MTARPSQDPIERLEALFASLPGLGPRSSARIVNRLLTDKRQEARELARTLADALDTVRTCPRCHRLIAGGRCSICDDSARDGAVVCVVESAADLQAIEQTVAYRGGYFVLMGRVNPLEGIGPEDLGVDVLVGRIARESVREVVIATSYTPEGETTAHCLATVLKKHFPQLRVTRLARGLPTGVEIEYTDAATLAAAVAGRR